MPAVEKTAPLHLVRLNLVTAELFRRPTSRRVLAAGGDPGYLVHSYLAETFGAWKPQPFALFESSPRGPHLLAYSRHDALELRRAAAENTSPANRGAFDPECLASRALPALFPPDLVLGFRLRACPVTRKSRGSSGYRPGAEIDIYLDAREKAAPGKAPRRENIYLEWIRGQLEADGACRCLELKITALAHTRFLRRDARRQARLVTRPDVTFAGRLAVGAPAVFRDRLARGVGRHRAFGFGMLLLRPG